MTVHNTVVQVFATCSSVPDERIEDQASIAGTMICLPAVVNVNGQSVCILVVAP